MNLMQLKFSLSMCTRSDIAKVVGVVSYFLAHPKKEH